MPQIKSQTEHLLKLHRGYFSLYLQFFAVFPCGWEKKMMSSNRFILQINAATVR